MKIVLGHTVPRLYTKPLVPDNANGPCGCGCGLTPETSDGFALYDWTVEFGIPLLPFQRWLAIHIFERHPNDPTKYRFRSVLVTMARQQGKTWLVGLTAVFRGLFRGDDQAILASAKASTALRFIEKIHKLVKQQNRKLLPTDTKAGYKPGNNDPRFVLENGWAFRSSASNDETGRGDTIPFAILDELRQHTDEASGGWDALDAATARPKLGMLWAISTAGRADSLVMNGKQDQGRLNAADPDYAGDFFYAEWSAPEELEPSDPETWAYSCPSMNHPEGMLEEVILGKFKSNKIASFRNEWLNQRSDLAGDPPVSAADWELCKDLKLQMTDYKNSLHIGIDAASDAEDNWHITATAVAIDSDGKARIRELQTWVGTDAPKRFRNDLPGLLDAHKPLSFGYANVGAVRGLETLLAPLGPTVIKASDIQAAVMGLSEEAKSRRLLHSGQDTTTAQVTTCKKLTKSDGGFMVSRNGSAFADAYYAAAVALRLARTYEPVVEDDFVMPVFILKKSNAA